MKTISKDVVILETVLNFRQTHTHSCTFTLKLSTCILPWVILFSPVSFVEASYWKCICSSFVSKESAYLMLTSWDLACKQTWSPPLPLKITTRSHGWVKEETERKEGRCGESKEKKEMWREGMRWSQSTVGVCCSGQSVFPEAGLRHDIAN